MKSQSQQQDSPIFISGFVYQFRSDCKKVTTSIMKKVLLVVVSAEVIKNCVKYIFLRQCLLMLLTGQFLIWFMFKKN
jgi:hypothetical protein